MTPVKRLKQGLLALLAAGVAIAIATATTTASAAEPEYDFAISEGTSGGLNHGMAIAKYGALAEAIGKALGGRKVRIVYLREFASLEEGLASQHFDLVMARPSDYPARAVRDHGYHFVATARPEGQCLIVVPKDSPAQSLADLSGKRWVLPERVSYMSRLCSADLRDRKAAPDLDKLKYVREQGAVTFYLSQGLADAGGIASYSGAARGLEKAGVRILHRSDSQPYFPMIAGPRLSAEQIKAVQTELLALQRTDRGQGLLKALGIESFDVSTGPRLEALLDWLDR